MKNMSLKFLIFNGRKLFMLEVVFEENAAGSMKVAAGMTKYDGGATGVIVVGGRNWQARNKKDLP